MFGHKEKEKKEITPATPADITATTVDKVDVEEEEMQVPPITWKEIRNLKRSNYDKVRNKYKKAFVLLNKRTGQIAEINAASSYQACNMIGWKPRKCRVLEVKDLLADLPEPETQSLGKKDEPQEEKA